MMMKYKTIPHSSLNVSMIGLGTWVFGGDSWGGADEDESLGAIQAAADAGINLIDTAPIYGNGRSETIVGKGIRRNRERWVVATKCGPQIRGGRMVNDLSAKSVARQLDDSLRRLNIDRIDLYQCHWPDEKTPVEETLEYLNKAQQQGKIKYIGVSNFDVDLLRRAASAAQVVTLQSQYSLLDKTLEERVIPFCLQHQIGILAYGPLAGGILTGKYKQSTRFQGADARQFFYKYYGERFSEVNQTVERLSRLGKPLNQIALNWVRQKESVASVLAGCRNAAQVTANGGAVAWDLSAEEIGLINEVKCGS